MPALFLVSSNSCGTYSIMSLAAKYSSQCLPCKVDGNLTCLSVLGSMKLNYLSFLSIASENKTDESVGVVEHETKEMGLRTWT